MIRRIILFLLAVLPLAAGAQPHFDYATGDYVPMYVGSHVEDLKFLP